MKITNVKNTVVAL